MAHAHPTLAGAHRHHTPGERLAVAPGTGDGEHRGDVEHQRADVRGVAIGRRLDAQQPPDQRPLPTGRVGARRHRHGHIELEVQRRPDGEDDAGPAQPLGDHLDAAQHVVCMASQERPVRVDAGLTFHRIDDERPDAMFPRLRELQVGGVAGAAQADDAGLLDALDEPRRRHAPGGAGVGLGMQQQRRGCGLHPPGRGGAKELQGLRRPAMRAIAAQRDHIAQPHPGAVLRHRAVTANRCRQGVAQHLRQRQFR